MEVYGERRTYLDSVETGYNILFPEDVRPLLPIKIGGEYDPFGGCDDAC